MPQLQANHADEECRSLCRLAAGFEKRGTVHVGLKEGNKVGSSLADNKVVDVEKLGDATQGRVALRVRRVCPMAEVGGIGGCPGNNIPVGVLAEDCRLTSTVEG